MDQTGAAANGGVDPASQTSLHTVSRQEAPLKRQAKLSACCRAKPSTRGSPPSPITSGIGVTLYYRFLKFMIIVMGVLSLLAVPNMLLMFSGGKLEAEVVTPLDRLSLLTMGNLGEGLDVCSQALDGESVEIQCPAGAVVGNIQAYYGLPSGSCSCPAAQQPSRDSGECDGGNIDGAQCLPEGSYCHLEVKRQVPTPTGDEFRSGSCCAHQLVDNRPDFGWLSVVLNSHCHARGAEIAVEGLCLGAQACSIPASSRNITWQPSEVYGTECPDGGAVLPNGDCTYPLDPTGDLASCVWPNATLDDPDLFDLDAFEDSSPTPTGYSVVYTDGRVEEVAAFPENGTATQGVRFIHPISSKVQLVSPELPAPGQHRLLVIAQCFDTSVFVFTETFSKTEVAVFLGMFDAVIVILFMFAILMLGELERQEVRSFRDVSAADYSVFMPKLPPHQNLGKLDEQLRLHFSKVVSRAKKVERELTNPAIADISFAMANTEVVELLEKRGKVLKRMDKRIQSMLLKHKQGADERTMEKVKAGLNKLKSELEHMDRVLDQRESTKGNEQAVSAYITFEEEEACLRALETYPRSTLLYYCCQKRANKYAGIHRVWVQRADEPTDINWANLNVNTRTFRVMLTTLFTLLVLALSGLAVFLAEDAKRTVAREYTSADCATFPEDVVSNKTLVVQDEFFEEFGLNTGRTGLLECHCLSILDVTDPEVMFNTRFDTPTGSRTLCVSWFSTYLQVQVLSYGTAIITLTVNLVLRYILKFVVKFERHKSKTSELLSRAFKMFVLQFLNTAAIVLFIHARIDTDFEPLRRGEFTDFSQDWYASVGVSITLTMCLNIILPHGPPMLAWLKTKVNRCRDRSCTCDHHRTKCITQRQLNNTYLGPKMLLDERYAQAFNVIFVCLTFSTGLPILLPVAMVSFIVSFWVDKFLFAYVYRTPPRYGPELAAQFTSLLPFAALLKLAVGFWMLTNGDIFPPANAVQGDSTAAAISLNSGEIASANEATLTRAASFLDGGNLDFGRRVGESHAIPHIFLLVLTVFYLLMFRVFVLNARRLVLAICPCLRFGCSDRVKRALATGKNLPNYFDAIPTEVLRDLETRPVKRSLQGKLQEAVRRRSRAIQERSVHMENYHRMVREAAQKRLEGQTHMQEAERQALVQMREMLRQAEFAEQQARHQRHEQMRAQRQAALERERERRQRVFLVRQEKAGWGAHEEALVSALLASGPQWRTQFNALVASAPAKELDPLIEHHTEYVAVTQEETVEEEETPATPSTAGGADATEDEQGGGGSGGLSPTARSVDDKGDGSDSEVGQDAEPSPTHRRLPSGGEEGDPSHGQGEGDEPPAGTRDSANANPGQAAPQTRPEGTSTKGGAAESGEKPRRPSLLVRRIKQHLVPRDVATRVDPWSVTAAKAPSAPAASPGPTSPQAVSAGGLNGTSAAPSAGHVAVPVAGGARPMLAEDFLLTQHVFLSTTAKLPGAATAVQHTAERAGSMGQSGPTSPSSAADDEEEVWAIEDDEDLLAMAAGGGIRDHEDEEGIAAVVEEQLQQELGSMYVPPEDLTGHTPMPASTPGAGAAAASAFAANVEDWGGTGAAAGGPVSPPPPDPHLRPSSSLVAGMVEGTEAAARAHQAEQAAERQKAIAEEFYRRMGLDLKVKKPEVGEIVQMHGQVSYDIFESKAMLARFGFDTDVPKYLKRRLKDPAGRSTMARGTVGSLRSMGSGSVGSRATSFTSPGKNRFRSRVAMRAR